MSKDPNPGGGQSIPAEQALDELTTLRKLAKFRITKFQYFLASISLLSLLSLGVFATAQSTVAVDQARILSAIETPAASIIFTQRETLVYATRLGQWSHGGTSRRNVQIARNLLAQRLAVIDASGMSMGERAPAGYWNALRKADEIVANGPVGVVPENIQNSINEKISPVIDRLVAESRQFVVSYQKSIDKTLMDNAKRIADRDRINLALLYLFLIFGGLFIFFNFKLNFKNYRQARIALDIEQIRLNQMIEELKQSQSTVIKLKDLDQAKNAFISTVNHELRTPLTSIIGYIDIIRDEVLDKENKVLAEYLEVLERNAEVLLGHVESILSLSRIDADTDELPEIQVSMNKIIDQAIFLMKPALEKKDLQVHFIAASECTVQGSASQLNQVIINLLSNAAKFSSQGSSIEIKLEEITDVSGQQQVRIAITDHGIGIPPEDLEHLFARFFRAKNAVSQQYPGTGLGLAIVQQVVTRHGGQVHVQSVLNEGTTFTVDIPAYVDSETAMINERRPAVLQRAIESLNSATPETIKAVTHDVGGAIGFYGSADLSAEILQYSRDLKDIPDSQSFEGVKARFIAALTTELEKSKVEDHE